MNESKAQKAKFSDLTLPHNLRPSLIMFGLMVFQQLSGKLYNVEWCTLSSMMLFT